MPLELLRFKEAQEDGNFAPSNYNTPAEASAADSQKKEGK
jgi:hypothetical protein